MEIATVESFCPDLSSYNIKSAKCTEEKIHQAFILMKISSNFEKPHAFAGFLHEMRGLNCPAKFFKCRNS